MDGQGIADSHRPDTESPEKSRSSSTVSSRRSFERPSRVLFVLDQFLEMLYERAVTVLGYGCEQLLALSQLYEL